jgi:SAM-dependent methyltransferase
MKGIATAGSPEEAWRLVQERFPFPGYLQRDKGHVSVAHTVMRYLRPGDKILDFGAGPCDKTAVLAALGFSCTAADDLSDAWHLLDSNRDTILDFAASFGIEYLLLAEGQLPDKHQAYDMVMLHDVIEHLHNSPRELMMRLLETLKPNGYLFITVPNHVNLRKRFDSVRGRSSLPSFPIYYWHPDPWRGHVREYTRDDCEKIVEYLDLELLELHGTHHMLEKVPERLMSLYLWFSRLVPDTRDTWSLVARKAPGWDPKRQLSRDEVFQYTGLSGWTTD